MNYTEQGIASIVKLGFYVVLFVVAIWGIYYLAKNV